MKIAFIEEKEIKQIINSISRHTTEMIVTFATNGKAHLRQTQTLTHTLTHQNG